MSGNPGDWVADRDMLALAAADPSLSDGAVRCLCLARFGVMDPEAAAWAKSIAHKINIAALSQSHPQSPNTADTTSTGEAS
jgi:hypothetical protein